MSDDVLLVPDDETPMYVWYYLTMEAMVSKVAKWRRSYFKNHGITVMYVVVTSAHVFSMPRQHLIKIEFPDLSTYCTISVYAGNHSE